MDIDSSTFVWRTRKICFKMLICSALCWIGKESQSGAVLTQNNEYNSLTHNCLIIIWYTYLYSWDVFHFITCQLHRFQYCYHVSLQGLLEREWYFKFRLPLYPSCMTLYIIEYQGEVNVNILNNCQNKLYPLFWQLHLL